MRVDIKILLEKRLKQTILEIKLAIRSKKISNFLQSSVYASGDLEQSVDGYIYESGFVIKANDYVYYLEFGRRPTRGGASGGIGGMTLQKRIRKWIDDKNITPREKNMTKDSLAFLITRKIHKEGTTIWRHFKGKPSGLISDVFNTEWVDSLLGEVGDQTILNISTDILKDLQTA